MEETIGEYGQSGRTISEATDGVRSDHSVTA
jgi:hypothetical protein